jgi:nucleotide-binding universal stress UspA family protein
MEKFEPKLILCPTDFSEPATLALHYAKEMAACSGAELMVLYADRFMPPPYFTSGQLEELTQEIRHSKQRARQRLKAYVREHLGDSESIQTLLVEDLAVPAILKTAKERDAGFIVMGSHGHGGFSRTMLGSVMERVLREADRPVLTVRLKEGKPEPQRISIKRLLCPVNMMEVSSLALEHAAGLAECFGADLQVLYVIESAADEKEEKSQLGRLCSWIPGTLRSRCNLQEMVAKGDAAEQIITMAGRQECDMIVLGAQHKRFVDTTVIGTTTVRVTRHAPCPVYVVIRK